MQRQRSEIIDLTAAVRARDRRTARRLLLETIRIRRPIPAIPRFGRAAAVLVEDHGDLAFIVSPELDELDVTLAAYALAMRFAQFDRADAIRLSTLRKTRRALDRTADRAEVLEQLVGS